MDRYNKILGLNKYQPKEQYVCFLPWVSEFGWYIMNHVKRFHGYNHNNKIACIKPGHECLFPTTSKFFFDWIDNIPDKNKGGIVKYGKHNDVINKITEKYGKSVKFIYPEETGWNEKTSLAHHTFIPNPLNNHNFKVDIIVTPRLRELEPTRNYKHWQKLVDLFVAHGWTVGVCGKKELSYKLNKAKYYSYNYIDVDSDIELILNSKLIITQESGMAYLTYMCKKPVIIIDSYVKHVADKHRDLNVWFREMPWAWNDPDKFIYQVKKFMLATL